MLLLAAIGLSVGFERPQRAEVATPQRAEVATPQRAEVAMPAAAGRLQIDPAFAKNITVYHVNPHKYGAVPLNMDTADPAGDLFFDFHNVLIMPLQCPQGAASGHGCTNPEAVAPDL